MNLSDTQQAILRLLAERIEAEGMPPSQTEIAAAFGFKSVRAAQYHLEALAAAGVIERVPGRARGIRILKMPAAIQPDLPLADAHAMKAATVPVLGQVAAGLPIGADPDWHGEVLIDPSLFSPMPDYLLRVRGASMRDEGILDGDLIGVRRSRDARSGQIVVARIDEEITVKRLKIGASGVQLMPANADFAPIDIQPDQDFAIEGVYCGLLRPNR